ncbi:hypothetical protein [Ureibacillus sp. FSL K6-2830]|uniref:hypothetical protein n=1 Tax=Ureibacillus sp. FSL K6-2830 TaxID=2954610 RepID=UPI0030F7BDFA
MRQTYYGVDSVLYHELENHIKQFSQLTRDLFSQAITKEQKVALMKEKEEWKETIQNKLLEDGTILGFLTMEQIDDVETTIQVIEDEEIKGLLRSNFIPNHKLEEVIVSLMKVDSTDYVKNLIFFLEKAKQNQQSVIVWIME